MDLLETRARSRWPLFDILCQYVDIPGREFRLTNLNKLQFIRKGIVVETTIHQLSAEKKGENWRKVNCAQIIQRCKKGEAQMLESR